MNWGAFAGGAAEGYNRAEKLRIEREKADREGEQFDWKRQEQARAAALREGVAALPTPGEYADFDPDNKLVRPPPAALPMDTPERQGGLLSGIARALRPQKTEEAAIAAGVLPPPQPAALPAEGPAGEGAVDPVAVMGRRLPRNERRKVTDADLAMERWRVAKESGDPAAERAAFQEFHNAKMTDTMKTLAGATEVELEDMIEKNLGAAVEITQNPNTGSVSVEVNGKPWKNFDSWDRLIATGVKPLFDGDIAGALKFATELDTNEARVMQSRAAVRQADAQIKEGATRTQIASRAQGLDEAKYLDEKKVADAVLSRVEALGTLDPVLDAEDYDALAGELFQVSPKSETAYVEDAEGNRTPVSVRAQFAQAKRDQFAADKFVQEGLLYKARAADKTGNVQSYYVVKGDTPGKGYRDFTSARRAAERLHAKKK